MNPCQPTNALDFQMGFSQAIDQNTHMDTSVRPPQFTVNTPPQEILTWVWDTFGEEAAMTSSFQTQSMPLLHMVAKHTPQMKVLFMDTGFHFPETLSFRKLVAAELGLKVVDIRPPVSQETPIPLHELNSDLCCYLNKVKPMQEALRNYAAWVSGIRHDQTEARSEAPVVGWQPQLCIYKINPMAHWSRDDILDYIQTHNLPRHPLWAQGYVSVGCQPCTAPIAPGQHERKGRWPGNPKTECGIHIDGYAPEEK